MPLSQKKLRTQAQACVKAVAIVTTGCLKNGRPADRTLAALLRANRQFGSRDRRLISETLFAVLRWWGWLVRMLPRPPIDAAQEDGAGPLQDMHMTEKEAHLWSKLCLAACLLENAELPPAADIWAETSGIPPEAIRNIDNRDQPECCAATLCLMFNEKRECGDFSLARLVPDWVPAEIPNPLPMNTLIEWLQKRPPVWLRIQNGKVESANVLTEMADAGLKPKPHPVCRTAVHVTRPRINLRTLDCFRAGNIEVQDLASQAIGMICAPNPGERWWDACAGAGGKSLELACLMQRKGTVVASDIRDYKLDDLQKRARRAGLPNIRRKKWNGKAQPKQNRSFDGVLVDAPCTCSGTWRRNPEARWTTGQDEVEEMRAVQSDILRNTADAVRSGGVLVYATCSMFTRENHAVVYDFLADRPDFELLPFTHPLTREHCDGTVQIWPWEGDCDAMFAARMRRIR